LTTPDLVNGLEGAETGGAMYIMKSYVDYTVSVYTIGAMYIMKSYVDYTVSVYTIYITGMEPEWNQNQN
jgi:hypothetical protein